MHSNYVVHPSHLRPKDATYHAVMDAVLRRPTYARRVPQVGSLPLVG
jgi:hypothetical protein